MYIVTVATITKGLTTPKNPVQDCTIFKIVRL